MNLNLPNIFEKLVWGDHLEKTGPLGRFAAVVLRYIYGLGRDIVFGQLTLRAMSLVYTTLLSVVPLIAFSFSVLKGLGKHKELEPLLYDFLAPLGPQGEQITQQVIALVDNVKGSVLGGVSLAFFIYTAISMVQKVEESFNYVWYVSKPRSFARRFSEYFFVLLIGPILMVTALGMITSIRSNAVVQMLLANESLGRIFVVGSQLTPYLLITGVFTFLYMYMPNTKVKFKAALVGGLAGGFLWASAGAFFATFILYASRTQLIYSGFAVAITTLIWLYLSWLILLIGAQLAFYFQQPAFLRIGRREPRLSNSMRERLALNVMYLVGKAFRDPDATTSIREISQQLSMPSIALAPVTDALEGAALLITTENEELLPGREMSRIPLNDILAVVRTKGETGSYRDPAWTAEIDALGAEMDGALARVTAEKTLSDLLDGAEDSGAGDGHLVDE
ncbi:MAG: YihY/virulence factor BrkB family protein [Gammaproteobacteria bacterium]|nr:MAG: YihY/virulence factor BrkB family protein [Gammaproteobacteria bacterium]